MAAGGSDVVDSGQSGAEGIRRTVSTSETPGQWAPPRGYSCWLAALLHKSEAAASPWDAHSGDALSKERAMQPGVLGWVLSAVLSDCLSQHRDQRFAATPASRLPASIHLRLVIRHPHKPPTIHPHHTSDRRFAAKGDASCVVRSLLPFKTALSSSCKGPETSPTALRPCTEPPFTG